MRSKNRAIVGVLFALLLLDSKSVAQGADTQKVLAQKQAVVGCAQFTLSMTINDSFLKLSAAEQTKARSNQAIAAENLSMATALKAFKAAAKYDKKWSATRDNLDAFIHTDTAAVFTKAFNAVLATCTTLAAAIKK